MDSLNKMNFQKRTSVKVIEPNLTENVVRDVRESIENVVSKELNIKYGEKKWVLGAEDLLGLIEISTDSKNENKLKLNESTFKDLADSISFELIHLRVGKLFQWKVQE